MKHEGEGRSQTFPLGYQADRNRFKAVSGNSSTAFVKAFLIPIPSNDFTLPVTEEFAYLRILFVHGTALNSRMTISFVQRQIALVTIRRFERCVVVTEPRRECWYRKEMLPLSTSISIMQQIDATRDHIFYSPFFCRCLNCVSTVPAEAFQRWTQMTSLLRQRNTLDIHYRYDSFRSPFLGSKAFDAYTMQCSFCVF